MVGIISDGNRTNQSYFSCLKDDATKQPWLSKDGQFLLYGYIHVAKGIRNSWLTEKTQTLAYPIFDDNEDITSWKFARWEHLVTLHKIERGNLNFQMFGVKASRLTDVAIKPKPIECQRTSHVLCVFPRQTIAAFRTNELTVFLDLF